MKNKYVILALVLVIIFRLYLIILPSFKIDMGTFQAWSVRLVEVTPVNFYSPDYFSDYFPGYLYMLWFLGKSAILIHLPVFSLGFEFYLKLFTNIFDLATAYYIYKIVSKYQKRPAILSAIFYLINPALAFNSSVWGQVDGILTFFMVCSTYYLLELKKPYHFSFIAALSILVKPQGLAVFPITLMYAVANFNFKKNLILLFIPTLLIILSLPFFLKDPILGLFHLFQKSTNIYPYASMLSYNFWSFVGWWINDSNKFLGGTYRVWGIAAYFLSLAIILIPIFRRKINKDNFFIYFASALSILSFFLFLTRIHQRYLFPFFAFLLIVALIRNSLKLMAIYWVMSIIHLANLWYVYYYYNYIYSNSKFSEFFIYRFLDSSYNLFTILNLICFGMLILIYYNFSRSQNNNG